MKILYLVALQCLSISLFGQNHDSTEVASAMHLLDSTVKVKSHFSAGLQYLSDNVYTGRKDSARIPYLTATLGYYHKTGLFLEGAVSMLSDNGTRVDAGILTGGWMFTRGNFDGEISASKFFYNELSQNVRSEVKGSMHASAAYDFNGALTTTLDGYMNFANKTDYMARFGLNHTFFLFSDHLEIDPTVSANAGTQHYYDAYYNLRHLTRPPKKKKKREKPTMIADMSGASNFTVLDYEISLPISYTLRKRFTLSFEPTYALPVHPAVLTLTTLDTKVSRVQTEPLSNQFYWMFGITYKW